MYILHCICIQYIYRIIVLFHYTLFQNHDAYRWSTGLDLTYRNWLTAGQEVVTDDDECAVVDIERFNCVETCEYPDGNWLVKPCDETHPYMCKYGPGNIFA